MKFKIYIKKNFGNSYSGSGQLGQDAAKRIVTITGTATYNEPVFRTLEGVRQNMKAQFEERSGWRIINLAIVPNGSFTGFRAVPAGINLTAEVPGEYSNQDHLNEAYARFNGYGITAISTVYPFTNVSLSITGADKPNYVPPVSTTITGTPTPTPAPKAGNNSTGYFPTAEEIAAAMKGVAPAGTDLLSTLSTYFGVGVPIVAVAGIAIVVVALKRR